MPSLRFPAMDEKSGRTKKLERYVPNDKRRKRTDEEKASLPESLFLPKKAVGGERFAVLDERNA